MGKLQRMPFKFRKAVFLRLEDIVDIVSLSKEDRIKYDESIKVYRYNLVAEAYARSSRTASIAGSFLSEWREMCQIADNFSKAGKRFCNFLRIFLWRNEKSLYFCSEFCAS